MANYRVEFTAEDVKWPAYVSTVTLEGETLKKAENVLDNALVTLETYGGPRFIIYQLRSAKRTGIFLYEINCVLVDAKDVMRECVAKILNEPWMKANSIAAASFQFSSEDVAEKLVVKRKKSIKYYKDTEMIYGEQKNVNEPYEVDNKICISKDQRITDV